MAALEFWASINTDDTLPVPSEIAAQLQRGQPVRVILVIPDTGEEQEWAHLTADEFLKGYAEGDSVYGQLSAG
jgi:hypothetical protein